MALRPEVEKLADKLGVPLAARSVSGNYFWDGKSLGIFYQEWDPAWDDEPWNPKDNPPRLLPKLLDVPEFDILHDMAHWCMALPWALDLPEWGLPIVDTDFGANGGYHLGLIGPEAYDGLLDLPDQIAQEEEAYLLGLHFCKLLDVKLTPDNLYWLLDYHPGRNRFAAMDRICQKFPISKKELEAVLAFYPS